MAKKKKSKGGNAKKGEGIFSNLCAVCHAFGSHGTGPDLKGTAGGPSAAKDGFAYS